MTRILKSTLSTLSLLTLLAVTGCAGMSQHDQNTAIGAGVGAVGGSILTGGSSIGTIGGAAVGGVIGSEIHNKDRR